MSWPSGQDYREAIQTPNLAFKDPELRLANVECDMMGLPRPRSGGFATVYKATGSKAWAVRCFNRQVDDQQERYAAISVSLEQLKLPYTVDFAFLKEGILVKGHWYPILKMEWVSGDPLNVFVERNLGNPNALLRLAQNWVAMANGLQRAGIAHGDLQHGNVLVVGTSLKLVDYDGMFVPALRGKPSHEAGQPNYQLPARGAMDYGPYLDNFSAWVILLSLVAVARDPSLWHTFKGGDECLLFRKRDFEAPDQSLLIQTLSNSRDGQLAALTNLFRSFLSLSCAAVPPLDQSVTIPVGPSVPIPQASDWIKDHLKNTQSTEQASFAKTHLSAGWILDFTEPPPIPLPLTGNFTRERICVWSALVGCVVVGVLLPWQLSLIAVTVVWLICAVYLRNSYFKQPNLASLQDIKRALAENEHQVGRIRTELKRQAGIDQAIRKDERVTMTSLSDRQQKLGNEERKVVEDARKRQETAVHPLLRDRKKLDSQESSELTALQNTLGNKVSGLKAALASLKQAEANEFASALQAQQTSFLRTALASERIYDASIPGIGSGFKARLHASGFHTAADVDYYRVQRVPGIGTKKAAALFAWKQLIESRAHTRMPQSLSSAEQSAITAKYVASRLDLQNQLARFEQQLKGDDQAIRARYVVPRSALDSQMSAEQAKFGTELGQIAAQFKGRQMEITKQIDAIRKSVERKTLTVQEQIAVLTRELAVIQWKRARLEREAQRYGNIRVPAFIRVVAIGR